MRGGEIHPFWFMTGYFGPPTALYNNVPIMANYYAPNFFYIASINIGPKTLVTTTTNHNYVVGQLVRLLIPEDNGCYQLNEQTAYVINIPSSTEVLLDLNSGQANAFIATSNPNQPQILAIGDVNTGATNYNGLKNQSITVPGSFINISPN